MSKTGKATVVEQRNVQGETLYSVYGYNGHDWEGYYDLPSLKEARAKTADMDGPSCIVKIEIPSM